MTNQKAIKNGSTTLLDLSYEYNRNGSVGSLNGKTGHLTKIVDNLNNNKNREYEFDALGRLTKAKGGPTGNLSSQTYTYDRYGNRTSVTATGVAADTSTMPSDGIPNLAYDNTNNRITTTGFEYDVAGNQTRALAEDGVTWRRYEYDAANRLHIVKEDNGTTFVQAFQFGSTNARLMDTDYQTGFTRMFASVGGTVLAEYHENYATPLAWIKSYVYLGDSQLSTIQKDGGGSEYTEYNHPDRLGTRVITNQALGSSYEQAHLPFGTALAAETTGSTNKRFTTYDRSAPTGLDYAINRTYDSKLARFTQVDPIGMQAVSLAAPQTLNLYSYCGNDPINHTDPSGLSWGSFFRWLGRLFGFIRNNRVARRIAIRFVVSFALSGGNFGVAIRSIIPDILQATGIFPDPRSTVPWLSGTRLPISAGLGSLSRYIIYNFLQGIRSQGFIDCANNSGLGVMLGNLNFHDDSAAFVNRLADAEGTNAGLLGFTFQHETGFWMNATPNQNNSSDRTTWDWGPFHMNYNQTTADIRQGSYSAGNGVSLLHVFGAFGRLTIGGRIPLDPFQNGRLAARKLNWLVRVSPDLATAAARYTQWKGKRFLERKAQWNAEGQAFQNFFSCFTRR